MKRKYITINLLTFFTVLLVLLIITSLFLFNLNKENQEHELRNYLNIITNIYEGNEETSASILTSADLNIRVTFIDLEGNIIYDSSIISEENHLSRPEIIKLGEIYYRYSNTTNQRMIYIASLKDNTYIRVSIIDNDVNYLINSLLIYGALSIIVIALLLYFLNNKYAKDSINPLREEINKLSLVVSNSSIYTGDDLNLLTTEVKKVHEVINDKIRELYIESSKLNYIIEHINQGLIIINGNKDIILANKLALNILEYYNKDTSKYDFIIRNTKLLKLINKAFNNNINETIVLELNNMYYSYTVRTLTNSFASTNDNNGVIIFILNVTEEKKLDKMKTDFFNNASHELKSPLTTILGYQQLIEQGILVNKDEIKEATSKTISEAFRMNKIILEMLDLSRLESNLNKDKEELSILSVINSVIDDLSQQSSNKNISINIEKVNDLNVLMNSDDLYHLIKNLIENAIRYNKDNGSININIINNVLTIKDTGIGIKEEDLSRIFERFYRVDKARSKELGGTGLGLAIVKHVCLNYDIKINVESIYQESTTFSLDFTSIVK